MSLEGLHYILDKQEVVATFSAVDLVNQPEQVEQDYLRHVRTYVPISRAAEGGEDQIGVEAFERNVIRQVKEAKAPRGYLTAEYGYGKTSTALYLWQRAEESNIVTVPPFQMLDLTDLIDATYGWLRFRLNLRRPNLIGALNDLYEETRQRNLERLAREEGTNLALLQSLAGKNRLRLDIQPTDYVQFFERATEISRQAGYDGLIVLPDEIQQYIEQGIVSRSGDPIGPFFNLIQGLASRAGRLNFGFIMVIPLKELGVIREARGRDDFLHRAKDATLDLTTVYTPDFARNLWELLAQTFDFADVQWRVVRSETLDALGQIAARDDISNGPRTVVNVFRRMVERYLDAGYASAKPYTPIDLIEDFLDEQKVKFAGNDKIRNITRQALQSAVVQRDPVRFSPAIKLAAAFPTEGAPRALQQEYGVLEAVDELMRHAIGELVIAVGPVEIGGVTLSKLDRAEVATQWLPSTIRDFRRAYNEIQDQTRDRALDAFKTILQTIVFKNWRVVDERPRNFTSNLTLVFEGDFPTFAAQFPKRRVHVRILWENERLKDSVELGDIILEYHLSRHEDVDNRRAFAQPVVLYPDQHKAIIPLNLVYVRPEGVPPQILKILANVWSPYDLSPLILMNIYQMLEGKREQNLIPKKDDQVIKTGFQPEIMDSIVRDLFNPQVGAPLEAAGVEITAQACTSLLAARYGGSYHTLMAISTWRSSLQKYTAALERLEKPYQKRGDVEVEGTKDEIARLLVLTNTALDNFISNFSDIIELVRHMTAREAGAVRFRLHPLEEQIQRWLTSSGDTERIKVGNKQHSVRTLAESKIYNDARALGYQKDEIQEILNLMIVRGLIEKRHDQYREVLSQAPNLDQVIAEIHAFEADLKTLLSGFPNNNTLLNLQTQLQGWQKAMEQALRDETLDAVRVDKMSRNVSIRHNDLRTFVQDKQTDLQKQIARLQRELLPFKADRLTTLNTPIAGSVIYVDQVNVMRNAMVRQAGSVKSAVEQCKDQLDRAVEVLRQPQIAYDLLVQQANIVGQSESRVTAANEQNRAFEQAFQQLAGWRELVSNGSSLIDLIEQMENLTRSQATEFDRLARDIRAAISSSSNKLDVLPNVPIYATRLAGISEQVRNIRNQAVEEFTNLQNRYRQALVSAGLYKMAQLWSPFVYNVATPEESYRLLFEEVANRLGAAHHQLGDITRRKRQDLRQLLNTPLLSTIPDDTREALEQQAQELVQQAEHILERLAEAESYVKSIEVIQDYPQPEEGKFAQLVVYMAESGQMLATLNENVRILNDSLSDFALTPEEQAAFEQLSPDEHGVADLITWRKCFVGQDDAFWRMVRALYEKRRIRLTVEQVRRQ